MEDNAAQNPISENAKNLMALAEERFDLSQSERKLLQCVAEGRVADFSSAKDEENDVSKAEQWSEERTLRAEIIEYLCSSRDAEEYVTHNGIAIERARVEGSLNLSHLKVRFCLKFQRCFFSDAIDLEHTSLITLALCGSRICAMHATGMKAAGSISFNNGFIAEGEVDLRWASIGNLVNCRNGHFIRGMGRALSLDRIAVSGDIYMDNRFTAEGEVRLLGAAIDGDFVCRNGAFRNSHGTALLADGIDVKGVVRLDDGFKAKGEVRLTGAHIGGQLVCNNGLFENTKGDAFIADGIFVGDSLVLGEGFHSKGVVRLIGAEIGGEFYCGKGHFRGPFSESQEASNRAYGCALIADRMLVKGSVFFGEGFEAEGTVQLLGAIIGKNLECREGHFRSGNGNRAFFADNVSVGGSVFLDRGFEAIGEVRLAMATIGTDFLCSDGHFKNQGNTALHADGMSVAHNVTFARAFRTEGEVRLLGSKIGGDLVCDNGSFMNEGKTAINAEMISIGGNALLSEFASDGNVSFVRAKLGALVWTEMASPDSTSLNLRLADIDVLFDDQKSLPIKGNLHLQGLTYRIFDPSLRLLMHRAVSNGCTDNQMMNSPCNRTSSWLKCSEKWDKRKTPRRF